jgi:hypothetical protein
MSPALTSYPLGEGTHAKHGGGAPPVQRRPCPSPTLRVGPLPVPGRIT